MRLFPLNKNTMTLMSTGLISIGFFVAGMFEVLDYFIIKVLLFVGFAMLILVAFVYAFKSDMKKNRPEDDLQDDSH